MADNAAPTTQTTPTTPGPRPDDPGATTHLRTCPLCEACCGLEVTVVNDQVVRVRGDRDDPFSKGYLCPKGSTLKQLHHDPDRLTSPRIRTDAGWVQATWDQAFAEIARRIEPIIDRNGRERLGLVLGNPNVHNLGGMIYGRALVQAAGTKNLFTASTVDQMPKHLSAGLMWGRPDMFPLVDIDRCDYLLMLGANPVVSNGSLVTAPDFPGRLKALVERGRLVVVDPRRTETAEIASEHLTIQPGTDVWWLLAIINTLLAEDLVDIGRLADHVSGLDRVVELVADHTPESVAQRCGIDALTTRRIARELAAAPTAAAYGRMGIHTVEFGTMASWATDVINVLTGNLDRPGGIMFNCAPTVRFDSTPGGRGFATGRWHGPASGRPEVKGELPAATLAQEITDPDTGIKALIVVGANPVRSFPNSDRIAAALDELELMVSIDPYITATSRHAHVILPPPSALERSHYDLAFEAAMVRSFAKYSPAVFQTDQPSEEQILARLSLVVGGAGADADPGIVHEMAIDQAVSAEVANPKSPIHGRDKAEILDALGEWSWSEQFIDLRLRVGRFGDGFGADPDGLTLRRLIDEHPHGRDFGPLVERFPGAIKTASGTVELAPPLIVADFARLAAAPGPTVSNPTASNSEMALIGRRHLRSCNSWLHNVDVLVKGKPRCNLLVNPVDAERLGLVAGGSALVSSRVGELKVPVEISDEIMPGVVALPHGWGYQDDGIELRVARTQPGVNSNQLTDDAPLDTLSGNGVLNAIPVSVTAA